MVYDFGVLGTPYNTLLRFPPPVIVSSRSVEVTDSRICTGGISRGPSAARSLPFVDVDGCRLRGRELACTALSRIKQVVRLSHNFIVHFSPTVGHGAMQNEQESHGKRYKQQHADQDNSLHTTLFGVAQHPRKAKEAHNAKSRLPSEVVCKPPLGDNI